MLRMVSAVAWTVLIIVALLSAPDRIPRYHWLEFQGSDKLIHAFLFAVEALLLRWALLSRTLSRLVIFIVIWTVLLGGGLELAQHYLILGRSGEWADLMADTLGTLVALSLLAIIRK